MKRCSSCGQTRAVEDFPRNRSRADGRSNWCKPCHRADSARARAEKPQATRDSQRRYRQAHPERVKTTTEHNRAINLKARFDMTPEQYDELLELQGGGCAICGGTKVEAGRINLHIDHDYETNEVRGILCCNCNRGIGMFGDSPERLERAAGYLRAAAAQPTGFRVRVDFLDRRRKPNLDSAL